MNYKRALLYFVFTSLTTDALADNHFQLRKADGDSMIVLRDNRSLNRSTAFKFVADRAPISGLSVSGTITKSSPEYSVRVILKDKDKKEHIILESYEEINSNAVFSFSSYAEETQLLDNIVPDSIKICLSNASIQIDSFSIAYPTRGQEEILSRQAELRRNQIGNIVERINKYNIENGRPWIADVTEISLLPYEIKKRMMGFTDETSTGGLEYYAGGYFVVGHGAVNNNRDFGNDPYVDSFDWRNRHGKNWISSIKCQFPSFYCTVFAALACSESLIKLYYNNPSLEVDLSEQEVAACADIIPHNLDQGLNLNCVFDYIHEQGVCDEDSYPLVTDPLIDITCNSDNITPNEWFQMGSEESVGIRLRDIKSALIAKGPLFSGWESLTDNDHAMALVGYGKLHQGDPVWKYNPTNGYAVSYPAVTQAYDGTTYWIFKNSNGPSSGINGYYYLIFDDMIGTNSNVYIYDMINAYSIGLPIASLNYTDNDIIVEDADGDGYYNWGLGSKPASCPSWIPDDPDRDDSDSLKYKMDEYGHLQNIPQREPSTLISDVSNYSTNVLQGGDIIIPYGRTYTLYGSMIGIGHASITVKNGGKLIIDGGVWANAKLYLESGSEIIIRNGGKIYMSASKNFEAPIGCLVSIENGEINGPFQIKSSQWQ